MNIRPYKCLFAKFLDGYYSSIYYESILIGLKPSMKLTSTHLQDNMLFPLERTSLDPLDVDVENQKQDPAGQQPNLHRDQGIVRR